MWCSEVLEKTTKEPGGNFFLSFDSDAHSVNDTMNPCVGLFAHPTPAYYGGFFPQGELRVVIRGKSDGPVDVACPPQISAAMEARGVKVRVCHDVCPRRVLGGARVICSMWVA